MISKEIIAMRPKIRLLYYSSIFELAVDSLIGFRERVYIYSRPRETMRETDEIGSLPRRAFCFTRRSWLVKFQSPRDKRPATAIARL